VIGTEFDVYAPCALGGTLSVDTVPLLRCRIVAGSANNQLAQPEAAETLRGRGILNAPDYVISSGGAIAIVALELHQKTDREVAEALEGIGATLTQIYERAETEGVTTAAAAEALAVARLEAGR
jgi:leucine dehydrogenase